MEFHLWVGHEAPQAGPVLTMAKLRQLGTGEDERILYRQGRLCHRPHNGLDVLRERRIAMVQQALRVDFNFRVGVAKPRGIPLCWSAYLR